MPCIPRISHNDAPFMWRNLLVEHLMCTAEDDLNVRLHEIVGHSGGNDLNEE